MKALVALAAALSLAACTPPDLGDLDKQLCDPASMVVTEVFEGSTQTSGMVNARTPAGGYAGAVPFYVDQATGKALVYPSDWEALCPPPLPVAERTDLFIPDGVKVD